MANPAPRVEKGEKLSPKQVDVSEQFVGNKSVHGSTQVGQSTHLADTPLSQLAHSMFNDPAKPDLKKDDRFERMETFGGTHIGELNIEREYSLGAKVLTPELDTEEAEKKFAHYQVHSDFQGGFNVDELDLIEESSEEQSPAGRNRQIEHFKTLSQTPAVANQSSPSGWPDLTDHFDSEHIVTIE